MTEFNQYSVYSLYTAKKESKEDKIDQCVKDLQQIDEYHNVCEYLNTHFGNVENGKIIDFPELNKQVCIKFKEDAVEFFAAKNRHQFFSKGWLLVQKEEPENTENTQQ